VVGLAVQLGHGDERGVEGVGERFGLAVVGEAEGLPLVERLGEEVDQQPFAQLVRAVGGRGIEAGRGARPPGERAEFPDRVRVGLEIGVDGRSSGLRVRVRCPRPTSRTGLVPVPRVTPAADGPADLRTWRTPICRDGTSSRCAA
jgi:hypothetical protein